MSKHFKHWMVWHTCAKYLSEMLVCTDRARMTELTEEMTKASGVSWTDILIAYSYVEVDVQKHGAC